MVSSKSIFHGGTPYVFPHSSGSVTTRLPIREGHTKTVVTPTIIDRPQRDIPPLRINQPGLQSTPGMGIPDAMEFSATSASVSGPPNPSEAESLLITFRKDCNSLEAQVAAQSDTEFLAFIENKPPEVQAALLLAAGTERRGSLLQMLSPTSRGAATLWMLTMGASSDAQSLWLSLGTSERKALARTMGSDDVARLFSKLDGDTTVSLWKCLGHDQKSTLWGSLDTEARLGIVANPERWEMQSPQDRQNAFNSLTPGQKAAALFYSDVGYSLEQREWMLQQSNVASQYGDLVSLARSGDQNELEARWPNLSNEERQFLFGMLNNNQRFDLWQNLGLVDADVVRMAEASIPSRFMPEFFENVIERGPAKPVSTDVDYGADWINAGSQAAPTPWLQDIVQNEIEGSTDKEKIASIIRYVQTHNVGLPDDVLQSSSVSPPGFGDIDMSQYGAGDYPPVRSAEQILRDGHLYTCHDYATVVGALCRAAGIPTVFVQSAAVPEPGAHAVLEVLLKQDDGSTSWALLDASGGNLYESYTQGSSVLPSFDGSGRPFVVMRRGADMWDMGVHSLADIGSVVDNPTLTSSPSYVDPPLNLWFFGWDKMTESGRLSFLACFPETYSPQMLFTKERE